MQKTCSTCSKLFDITEEDLEFYRELSPSFEDEKVHIPPPTRCPECRLQRRLCFRNERFLYKRKCDLSGENIVSSFKSDAIETVYCKDSWWSDKWDALSYGIDFDFGKTFSEQFKVLLNNVPRLALAAVNTENSDYTNYAKDVRNSYLFFGGGEVEDCLYSRFVNRSRDIVDCLSLFDCELCYQTICSSHCYDCMFVANSRNCNECIFVEDCESCSNCLMCFGLYKKEYCILNKQLSKEDYKAYLKKITPLSREKIQQLQIEFLRLKSELPERATHTYSCENCSGDLLVNCSDCHYCFDLTEGEYCRHTAFMPHAYMCFDCTYGSPDGIRFSYELCSSVGTSNSIATFHCWMCESAHYCIECHNSKDIFGCVGLRNKQYCIFNKQYSKEEYEVLAKKIAQHMQRTAEWGEFFDPQLSSYGYAQTVANEFFPQEREVSLERGYLWKDEEIKTGSSKYNIPGVITEVEDSILKEVLYCKVSGKAYKIIPQELKWYRKMGIPIPALCPDERHYQRMAKRGSLHLWPRQCVKTNETVLSSIPPEFPANVCSEEAFREMMR